MTAVDCRWSQPTAFRPANDLDEDASPLDYPLDPFSQVGIDRAGVASKWKSYVSSRRTCTQWLTVATIVAH